jgi:predicted nucleotidyltransferase
MKHTRDEVLKTLQDHWDRIQSYSVRRLGLFGSCVRGEATETSDLDFIVEFERKTFDAYMDLKTFLEELFKCRVDLVVSEAIKPRLRETILKESVYAKGL